MMITKSMLFKLIRQSPFTEEIKKRLNNLVDLADEEGKKKIFMIVEKFHKKIENEKKIIFIDLLKKKAQEIKKFFHKKSEEIVSRVEEKSLKNIENALAFL